VQVDVCCYTSVCVSLKAAGPLYQEAVFFSKVVFSVPFVSCMQVYVCCYTSVCVSFKTAGPPNQEAVS